MLCEWVVKRANPPHVNTPNMEVTPNVMVNIISGTDLKP